MRSSVHIDNRYEDILILCKGPTSGLDDTKLTAEKECSINFTEQQKKHCLRLLCNRVNSCIFVNCVEICKFNKKDSEINAAPLCLGNLSKEISVHIMKKSGLNGYVYGFSVDYDNIDVADILYIHKNLLKTRDLP